MNSTETMDSSASSGAVNEAPSLNRDTWNQPGSDPSRRLKHAYEAVARAEKFLAESRKSSHAGSYIRDTLTAGFWSPEVFQTFGFEEAEKAPPLEAWARL